MFRSSRAGVLALTVPLALALGSTPAASASASPLAATQAAFRAAHFSHPTVIDNTYFPLRPGMQLVATGKADVGNGLQPHRNVFTVTNLTKVIDGIETRVIWDLDYSAGQLIEAELAFFAQDDSGTVWALGEYPEEFEGGKFAGAPSVWITGLSSARAGIAMLAHPRVGAPAYSQGYSPNIEFGDRARVFQANTNVCVPAGCFDRVLVTDEWDAFDPSGGHQRKHYAPGIGVVDITAVGGDQETLQLKRLVQLGPAALAAADLAATTMDRHGHKVSRIYARTASVQ